MDDVMSRERRFTCPKCGGHRLDRTAHNVFITYEVKFEERYDFCVEGGAEVRISFTDMQDSEIEYPYIYEYNSDDCEYTCKDCGYLFEGISGDDKFIEEAEAQGWLA